MGDKIASKKLAEKAKVNTIPGYTDVIRDAAHAAEVATQGRLSGHDQGQCRRRRQGAANRALGRRGP